jgi:hypothetical protein
MNEADAALYQAINEAERVRSSVRKKHTVQVKGLECDIIRATAHTWFQNHRPKVVVVFTDSDLQPLDKEYQWVVEASHRSAARSGYNRKWKEIKAKLVQLRAGNVVKLAGATKTNDLPPDFAKLISDSAMQGILQRRWTECVVCITHGAPLAATVMIGGLIEGLLLARVNRELNKKPVFTAAAAPKERSTFNPLPLKEWTLQDYIGVAHELKWITVAAKDVGVVLRDYRNYIHPQKEFSHNVSLGTDDAIVLWEIGKTISRQLLK